VSPAEVAAAIELHQVTVQIAMQSADCHAICTAICNKMAAAWHTRTSEHASTMPLALHKAVQLQ